MLLEGANHFSISDPFDATTARPFLDFTATQSEADLRNLIFKVISLFIDAHVCSQKTALEALNQLSGSKNPLIALFERK